MGLRAFTFEGVLGLVPSIVFCVVTVCVDLSSDGIKTRLHFWLMWMRLSDESKTAVAYLFDVKTSRKHVNF